MKDVNNHAIHGEQLHSEVNKSAERFFQEVLSCSGTWWTAAERIKMAIESRNAFKCEACEALNEVCLIPKQQHLFLETLFLDKHIQSQQKNTVSTADDSQIFAFLVPFVHSVINFKARFNQAWTQRFSKQILGKSLVKEANTELDAQSALIECMSVVMWVTAFDNYFYGVGLPIKNIPPENNPKLNDTGPSFKRITDLGETTFDESVSWFPFLQIEALKVSISEPETVAVPQFKNPTKALTLVTAEFQLMRNFQDILYLQPKNWHKMHGKIKEEDALSRAQVEVVATRWSELAECDI